LILMLSLTRGDTTAALTETYRAFYMLIHYMATMQGPRRSLRSLCDVIRYDDIEVWCMRRHKGALEALRDALYKYTTTTTSIIAADCKVLVGPVVLFTGL